MARRHKRPAVMDHGTPELRQHGDFEEQATDIAGVTHIRNLASDQLQTYFRRKRITDLQYDAGDRFAEDFYRAGIGPNYGVTDLTKVRVDQSERPDADGVHYARERVYRALQYVGQPLSRLLVHVCGHGNDAGSWKVLSKQRDGMPMLRLALNALASHYRLT